jgi:hypothetical protein
LVAQAGIVQLEAQIEVHQAELGTELLAQLSAAERDELALLKPRLEQLKVRAVTFCRRFCWHPPPELFATSARLAPVVALAAPALVAWPRDCWGRCMVSADGITRGPAATAGRRCWICHIASLRHVLRP